MVFLLDSSGSMRADRWQMYLQFVIDIMKGLNVSSAATHVGVIVYSVESQIGLDLLEFSSMTAIESRVFNLEFMAGVTNIADALKKMRAMFQKQGRDVNTATRIGVITDGKSDIYEERTPIEAQAVHDEGISMIAFREMYFKNLVI